MRYILSVIQHVLLGKLTIRHAIYALRIKPVAVTSKGRTWIIDPKWDEVTDDAGRCVLCGGGVKRD